MGLVMSRTCTRKLEFDSAHRVMLHESKCRNLHGHRYVAEVTALAENLDELGRVIDFSVIKELVGGWIDEHWDHGTLAHSEDDELIRLCVDNGWKLWVLETNPTAENLAEALFGISNRLLGPSGVVVTHIRLYETPNCWAEYHAV